MSLVGSLEDLGLGDILQIISLSRKTGILRLRADDGEGHILFRDGLIRSARLKGGPTDLRELMLAHKRLSAEEAESAREAARSRGLALEALLIERHSFTAEQIDELRRDYAESVVLGMFRWPEGDFSFEMREPGRDESSDLDLEVGVNPQFLALEGTRLQDEAGSVGLEMGEGLDFGEDLPGYTPDNEADPDPELVIDDDPTVEGLESLVASGGTEAVLETERVGDTQPIAFLDPQGENRVEGEVEQAIVTATLDSDARVEDEVPEPPPTEPFETPRPRDLPPVVVVDDQLASLEWTKDALAGSFPRVHIFQRTELGIARIRQYLARAEIPLVLLARTLPADPMTGAADFDEAQRRLKSQVPRMCVLRYDEAGRTASEPTGDDVVFRPPNTVLRDPRRQPERQRMAEELRRVLRRAVQRSAGGTSTAAPAAGMRRLKEISRQLKDPSSGVDVLGLVLSFASETFSRVALFVIRDGLALGAAQARLASAGGPDDSRVRDMRLRVTEPAWFRAVLATRRPVRGAPQDAGDEALAHMLGNQLPPAAYVAPIESGDQVVVLLYGDNLPGGNSIGDTSVLEGVLHLAGLALDRAALERALTEPASG